MARESSIDDNLDRYPILLPTSLLDDHHETPKQQQQQQRFSPKAKSSPTFSLSQYQLQQRLQSVIDLSDTEDALRSTNGILKTTTTMMTMTMPGSPLHSSAESSVSSMDMTNSTTAVVESPCTMDVVCVKGKQFANHPGNARFRTIIQQTMASYTEARTKIDKSIVIDSVIDMVRDMDDDTTSATTVRFLRFSKQQAQWKVLTTHQIRDKVGHALRDAVMEERRAGR